MQTGVVPDTVTNSTWALLLGRAARCDLRKNDYQVYDHHHACHKGKDPNVNVVNGARFYIDPFGGADSTETSFLAPWSKCNAKPWGGLICAAPSRIIIMMPN